MRQHAYSTQLTDQIREALGQTGRSLNQLSSQCGIDRGRLSRFLRGERDLTLTAASALCGTLGLFLTAKKDGNAKAETYEHDRTKYIEPSRGWMGGKEIPAGLSDRETVAVFRGICDPLIAQAKQLTDRNITTISPQAIAHKVVLMQRWAKELGRIAKAADQSDRQPIRRFCKAFAPVVREARHLADANEDVIRPREILERLAAMERLMKELNHAVT
jgi:transcriptional regulator with XRE-family HTH domain